MEPTPRPLTRRALLGWAFAAVAGTAGCTSDEAGPPTGTGPTSPGPSGSAVDATDTGPEPSPEPSPQAAEPETFPPYQPLAPEVEPPLKAAGAAFLTAALTTDGTGAGFGARVSGAGQPAAPAAALAPLLDGIAASSLRIVYPQSGGLADDRLTARLMVVAEQSVVATDDPARVGRRSVTVRLGAARSSATDDWQVTEAFLPDPVVPRPVSATSAAVQALLANPRVRLPEAARLDALGTEGIDDRIAGVLNALAERWVVDVSVLRSGHSVTVFGTDRTSNHAVGRGVDVWALDGIPIIERERSPWRPAMELAAGSGASEVGGPEEIAPEPYFTNASHQDHLHIGFGP
ncbi:MAG: hypothetical protein ACFCVG_09500 [Kineosporiaceae bacterium]